MKNGLGQSPRLRRKARTDDGQRGAEVAGRGRRRHTVRDSVCQIRTMAYDTHVDVLSSPSPRRVVFVLANMDHHDCRGSGLRRVRRRMDSELDSPEAIDQFHADRAEGRIGRSSRRDDVADLVPSGLHRNDFSV